MPPRTVAGVLARIEALIERRAVEPERARASA